MTYENQGTLKRMMLHSNQGSNYTSKSFKQLTWRPHQYNDGNSPIEKEKQYWKTYNEVTKRVDHYNL